MTALVVAASLQGCAAIPLAVIAGSLLEAGGSVLVKTGTEYTASGAALRTFNVPLAQVHSAVLETFRRSQIPIARNEGSEEWHVVTGAVRGRKVRVRLVPLTPVLTSMELVVKRNVFASDKATASELLAQVEHILTEPAAAQGPRAEPMPAPVPRRGG